MLESRTIFLLLAPLCGLMLLFFLVPIGLVIVMSVYDGGFTLRGFTSFVTSSLFFRVLGNTFVVSTTATLVGLVFGYPIALHIAAQSPSRRAIYIVLVTVPLWTSILVKSYAFTVVLGHDGLLNQALMYLIGPSARLELLFNRVGVIIGLTNYLLPFIVLPIFVSLLAQDPALARAARIMGAGPIRIFLRVTMPLSLPGVFAGVMMSMALSIGMYATPALLGGRSDVMMANLIDFYTRQSLDWNVASAIAVMLLLLTGVFLLGLMRARRGKAGI